MEGSNVIREHEVAAELAEARVRQAMSRSELARRSGTTRAALLEYEKGIRTPRADTFLRIMDAAGTTVSLSHAPVDEAPAATTESAALVVTAEALSGDAPENWRLLISDFVANEFVPASKIERERLIAAEPAVSDSRWMLFLSALAEHLATRGELRVPSWASTRRETLVPVWWPVHGRLASHRASAMAWSPASFKCRGILIDGREIPTVTR